MFSPNVSGINSLFFSRFFLNVTHRKNQTTLSKFSHMSTVNRRSFLQTLKAFSAGTLLSGFTQPAWSRSLHEALKTASAKTPDQLASDEDFWYYIQQSYTVSPYIINLNNGGVAPSPKPVQDAMKRYFDICNEAPSHFMWRILDQGREPLRQNLARIAGCNAEEIAIQRNASEALETVIFGLSASCRG